MQVVSPSPTMVGQRERTPLGSLHILPERNGTFTATTCHHHQSVRPPNQPPSHLQIHDYPLLLPRQKASAAPTHPVPHLHLYPKFPFPPKEEERPHDSSCQPQPSKFIEDAVVRSGHVLWSCSPWLSVPAKRTVFLRIGQAPARGVECPSFGPHGKHSE
ncbi:hypothetical protein BHM03_00041702 [Ensete ventricosum]|nr:hypothetical protein BHM03_00041702 [Ensete ventricosum]